MKTVKNVFALVFIITFTTACQRNIDDVVAQLMTTEEAAEIIESLLSNAEGGFSKELSAAAEIAIEDYDLYQDDCDYGKDTTFVCSNAGGVRSYDWNMHYQWSVECNNLNVPEMLHFKSEKTGNYKGPRLERTGIGLTSFELSNLSPVPADMPLILNGTADFDGTETLTRNNESLTATTDMTLTALAIDKSDLEITSGEGAFTIQATATTGQSETIEGKLRFLGGGTVEVTINEEVFVISI